MFDEKLSFRSHVVYTVTKLSKHIFILYKVRHFIPVYELVKIYYTLTHPHLICCITVWGGSYASLLNLVMVLQNRILRAICNAEFRASADLIYQSVNPLKLEENYRYMVAE